MSTIKLSADVKASSHPGRPRYTIDRLIDLADSELAQLREWLEADPKTPMVSEVGARLEAIGRAMGRHRVTR